MTLKMLSPTETAVLLIDHQDGVMSWVRSVDREEMKANALALAKAAKALDMPLVLTSSMEDHVQGPPARELGEIAPEEFAGRIKRTGVVDAMDDPDFAAAVSGTGRGHLIVAGVTNDVCTVYPVLTALEEGYTVYVVADAGGSTSELADDVALRRMEQAGAAITSTNMVLTGLAGQWTSPAGQALLPIVGELLPA